jgi:Fe-S-cluster-containing dehydrogenase component
MSISRREFVTGVAAGTLVASTARAGSVKHFPGHPDRRGLLHDTTLCVGCRSCEQACNDANAQSRAGPPVGEMQVFEKMRKLDHTRYTVVNRYLAAEGNRPAIYRKHQCMHCNEPCCASVCFVSAFTKTPEGPVLYDPDLCVGCRYCLFACPYNALSYEYDEPLTPRVVRCTMCYPRIKQGLNPACAEACPTGAIVFGKREELIWVARERIRKNPDRYIDHIFGEKEYGGTSWLALAGVEFSRLGLPERLSHQPLPNLTTGFLSLAPLAAAIFPTLLGGLYAFTKRRESLAEEEKREALQKARRKARREIQENTARLQREAERAQAWAVKDAVRDALREAEKKVQAPSKDETGGGA